MDNTYLPLAGLRRSDIRLTNVRQCFPGEGKSANKLDASRCAPHHIPREIEDTKPEVILLMGSSATKLCSGINIDAMHGIPQHTSKVGTVFGWEGWVVPMYNPAIGLREGRWMTMLLEDWSRLDKELGMPGDCPPRSVNYQIYKDGNAWVHSEHPIGIDTESHGSEPWSVQVSAMPGTGQLWRIDDREGIEFLRWMLSCENDVVFHNADHDLEVLRKLGIHVRSYRDTMQEAFHLGNLPQGLKPLVYRLFRQTMTSWEDTVRPASLNALLGWLGDALLVARADLYGMKIKEYKTCVCGHGEAAHWTVNHVKKCDCAEYRPRQEAIEVRGSAEALFDRLLNHTDQASEYDPWARLAEWRKEEEKEYAHVLARCGPWPILGIGNCTEAQAIRYAVGDADWTAQVAAELARRRGDSRFEIARGDEDR